MKAHGSKTGDKGNIGGIATNPDFDGLRKVGHAGRIDQLPCAHLRIGRIGEEYLCDCMKILRFDAGGIASDVARRNGRCACERYEYVGEITAYPGKRVECVGRGGFRPAYAWAPRLRTRW